MSPEAAPSIVADCPTIPVQTSQQVRRHVMGSTFTRYETSAFGNLDFPPTGGPGAVP
jgi:hypothetical protein